MEEYKNDQPTITEKEHICWHCARSFPAGSKLFFPAGQNPDPRAKWDFCYCAVCAGLLEKPKYKRFKNNPCSMGDLKKDAGTDWETDEEFWGDALE